MAERDQDGRDLRRTRWPTRLALAGVAFVLSYPVTWPWVYVVSVKLEELLGRSFGNHPIVVAVFNAYSTPLIWMVNSSPHLEQIYWHYILFVCGLCGVNFG